MVALEHTTRHTAAYAHRQRLATHLKRVGWKVSMGFIHNRRTGAATLHGLVLLKGSTMDEMQKRAELRRRAQEKGLNLQQFDYLLDVFGIDTAEDILQSKSKGDSSVRYKGGDWLTHAKASLAANRAALDSTRKLLEEVQASIAAAQKRASDPFRRAMPGLYKDDAPAPHLQSVVTLPGLFKQYQPPQDPTAQLAKAMPGLFKPSKN